MSKYIHNASGSEKTYLGVPVANNSFYLIPTTKELAYANNSKLVEDVVNGVVTMSADGSTDISGLAIDHLNFLKDTNKQVEATQYPFASKILADGKKLFRRVHGLSAAVSTTVSSHKFVVPYTACKITGVEIVGAEAGDFVDFNILDTTTGTITGVPNYKLNQFGFSVYLAANYHRDTSSYDADLFGGLQVEVNYTSVSSKTVYLNFILHQVT